MPTVNGQLLIPSSPPPRGNLITPGAYTPGILFFFKFDISDSFFCLDLRSSPPPLYEDPPQELN